MRACVPCLKDGSIEQGGELEGRVLGVELMALVPRSLPQEGAPYLSFQEEAPDLTLGEEGVLL